MLHDLPRWREPERLCQLALAVAVRRSGEPPLDFDCLAGIASPERIRQMQARVVEMPEIGLSGTDIRRRVAAGLGIRYRTPRAVEKTSRRTACTAHRGQGRIYVPVAENRRAGAVRLRVFRRSQLCQPRVEGSHTRRNYGGLRRPCDCHENTRSLTAPARRSISNISVYSCQTSLHDPA